MSTQKSKVIDDLLTSITGISRQDAEDQGVCTWCKGLITGFRNEISEKEYQISGFCQKCQDETFGED
jgi:hypothetical protein